MSFSWCLKSAKSNNMSLEVESTICIQTVNKLLNHFMDPRGMHLEDNVCDKCGLKNSSTKAVTVTQLSDVMIIQLKIFKVLHGISTKVFPNLIID